MKSEFGVVISIRRLRIEGSNRKEIVVKVGKPRKVKGADWVCPFQVSGLGIRKIEYGHGIDGMQALVQAIEGIRVRLAQSGKRLTWDGGEPGDTGFTRLFPSFYGIDFSMRLERLIEREVQRFARAAEKRHKMKGKKG